MAKVKTEGIIPKKIKVLRYFEYTAKDVKEIIEQIAEVKYEEGKPEKPVTLKDIKEHIFEYAWELLADSSFPIILQDENGKVIGKQR